MRISDWSSNVCSSDLQRRLQQHQRAGDIGLDERRRAVDRAVDMAFGGQVVDRRRQIGRASCRERVWSVRVDLGGRRIIKKKHITSDNTLQNPNDTAQITHTKLKE